MLMKKLFASLCVFAISQPVFAADWYNDITSYMGRVEQTDGHIWLMRPLDNMAPIEINGCNVTQVKLVPPAGLQDQWMSLIVTATSLNKPLHVWAECNSTLQYLEATRLIYSYK